MKRTYTLMEITDDGQWNLLDKITCEVTGEMNDRTKVWTRVDEDGELILDEQYFCTRLFGHYYFFQQ